MPAMTMPYVVSDPALLKDRAAGDLIKATLVVGQERAYLSTITKDGLRSASRRCADEDPGGRRRAHPARPATAFQTHR
jgi:hypothetical protein